LELSFLHGTVELPRWSYDPIRVHAKSATRTGFDRPLFRLSGSCWLPGFATSTNGIDRWSLSHQRHESASDPRPGFDPKFIADVVRFPGTVRVRYGLLSFDRVALHYTLEVFIVDLFTGDLSAF